MNNKLSYSQNILGSQAPLTVHPVISTSANPYSCNNAKSSQDPQYRSNIIQSICYVISHTRAIAKEWDTYIIHVFVTFDKIFKEYTKGSNSKSSIVNLKEKKTFYLQLPSTLSNISTTLRTAQK